MKRIIAAVSLALVIAVVSTASALACVSGTPSVSAPNGQSGPSQEFKRCLPNVKGTQKAAGDTPSPAVNNECPNQV